jgi:hypothetical protein
MDVVEFETTDANGQKVNFATPRCAKVTAKPRPLTWQVQQGLGMSGAIARFTGIGLASGQITLTMATVEHRVEFDSECKIYLASPAQGQTAKILKVKHPRLARLGISQIHLQDEPAGDWNEQTQIETVVYSWEEHRKPLPTLSSPTTAGATKDGAKAKNATADALKAKIAQNTATIDALSKQLAGTP